jgi:tRNA modification GTPase
LHDASGDMLDRALLLWLPGPATATGEDLAELHLHGGRAVVSAVGRAIEALDVRLAEPGEFTRRALFHKRLDLSAVEGLADLLAAETESQRRDALRRADGALTRRTMDWSRRLSAIAAEIEAAIDYDGEAELPDVDHASIKLVELRSEIAAALAVAPIERLRDGIRVAIVGPPNAGKSTLFNAMVGRNAAIVSDIPGTTRDAIERPVSIGGTPFVIVDTAGLRDTDDPVERIGVERARTERALADVVIDLAGVVDGSSASIPVISVAPKADIQPGRTNALAVSALNGTGMAELVGRLTAVATGLLPAESEVTLDRRHRDRLGAVHAELLAADGERDILLRAEHIRAALRAIDHLTGDAGIEDMLDALFGRFCLGK